MTRAFYRRVRLPFGPHGDTDSIELSDNDEIVSERIVVGEGPAVELLIRVVQESDQ